MTNSEASDKDYRIDVLRTCLYASNESANELAQEAKTQFGNFGETAALLGTEHTLFITIGVPWLQEQFKILINDPDISENRKKAKTQDGRRLRRYKRRWKVERLFAWLNNFRRLVVRYEYHADNYLGFVHLGCIVILLRYL